MNPAPKPRPAENISREETAQILVHCLNGAAREFKVQPLAILREGRVAAIPAARAAAIRAAFRLGLSRSAIAKGMKRDINTINTALSAHRNYDAEATLAANKIATLYRINRAESLSA